MRRTLHLPGSTGENVTIVGLDWSLVETGFAIEAGDDVAIEVTRYVTPCQAIRESFAGHGLNRISWRTTGVGRGPTLACCNRAKSLSAI